MNDWWVRPQLRSSRHPSAPIAAPLQLSSASSSIEPDHRRVPALWGRSRHESQHHESQQASGDRSWQRRALFGVGMTGAAFSATAGHGLINVDAAIARTTNRPQQTLAPRRSASWNLNAVGAPSAWARGIRGQGQVVAVIDTGIDLTHPDLRRNLWRNRDEIPNNGRDDDGNGFVDDYRGWDFVRNRPRPRDRDGHGTHVAGIIAAADNGVGTTGVAPRARLMPIRILGRNGASDATLARGIRYAVDNGADVINLSLGKPSGAGVSLALRRSLHRARREGVSVVIAAGNERQQGAGRSGEPAFWASTRQLGIAVGATTFENRTASFSNPTGNRQSNWFVVAPGEGIASTFRGGGTRRLSGTSMATPHVAGAVALVRSAAPRLRPGQVARLLMRTASVVE